MEQYSTSLLDLYSLSYLQTHHSYFYKVKDVDVHAFDLDQQDVFPHIVENLFGFKYGFNNFAEDNLPHRKY